MLFKIGTFPMLTCVHISLPGAGDRFNHYTSARLPITSSEVMRSLEPVLGVVFVQKFLGVFDGQRKADGSLLVKARLRHPNDLAGIG